jgi:ADP-ribose pyrophosphatase
VIFKEELIESQRLYEGKILNLRRDKVTALSGTAYREIVEHNGAVAVVAITDDNKIVMVRQYRYAKSMELLEAPAGKLEPGEDHRYSALRELEEEVGVIPEHLEYLGGLFVSPGISTETIHLYLATGLKQGHRHPDEDEFLNIETMPFEELLQQVLDGQIPDAKTAALVMRAQLQKERELHE